MIKEDFDIMYKQKEKNIMFLGFGFKYAKVKTKKNNNIKGGKVFLFNRRILTIAIADSNWLNEKGKPYKLKLDGGVLYINKIALGF